MNILVRLPNWLGDMVMSLGFINALKQTYPAAAISVIAKKELMDSWNFSRRLPTGSSIPGKNTRVQQVFGVSAG
ncbi:MAG TPA: hypothetical protein VEZ17_08795 [Chitinophagaceae bacterium]|nr:hypothetical protein [Chitinophagaceae bacterium]